MYNYLLFIVVNTVFTVNLLQLFFILLTIDLLYLNI